MQVLPDAGRTYMNNRANSAVSGTAAFVVDSSSDGDAEIKSAPKRQFEQDPSHTMTPGRPSPGCEDLSRPRTPGTVSVGELIPMRPDETADEYWDRFERNWELDPVTKLCV